MNRGYSLIELMMAVSVIMILSGGALAAFLNFDQRQKMTNDYSNVVTLLKSAYQKSTSGVYPTGCLGLIDYAVTIPSPSYATGIRVSARCQNDSYHTDHANILSGSVFVSGVSFAYSASSGVLSPITPSALSGGNVYLDIQSSISAGMTRRITISNFGVIW
jgi:prepilin-type N-terminal cleavage/methylation domain-containing protein